MAEKCPFCKLDTRNNKIVFETINFKFIENVRSQLPDHYFLITSAHVADENSLDRYLWTEYGHATRRVYEYFEKKHKSVPFTFMIPDKDETIHHFHKHFMSSYLSALQIQKALLNLLPIK